MKQPGRTLDPRSPLHLERIETSLAKRSLVFRWFVWYHRWSLRGSIAQQGFTIVTGIMSDKIPSLRPALAPLFWLQVVFLVASWLANPLFDLLLCFDRDARRAIPPWRRKGAYVVGGMLASTLLAALLAVATRRPAAGLFAGSLLCISFPASAMYRCPAGAKRATIMTLTITLLGLAVINLGVQSDVRYGIAGVIILGAFMTPRLAVRWMRPFPGPARVTSVSAAT